MAAATIFPACYGGTTCGKADHPWQPYFVRGDHLQQHNLPQMVRGTSCGGGPVVAGDQLRRDRSDNKYHRTNIQASEIIFHFPV